MQETYKYSILEEKHVTLQMGSSIAMKREGNVNQGFSRLDMLLMRTFKYFSTFEEAQTCNMSKKNLDCFSKSIISSLRVEKFTSASLYRIHYAGANSQEHALSKSLLRGRKRKGKLIISYFNMPLLPKFTSLAESKCTLNIYLGKEVYVIRCPHLKINTHRSSVWCYMTRLH